MLHKYSDDYPQLKQLIISHPRKRGPPSKPSTRERYDAALQIVKTIPYNKILIFWLYLDTVESPLYMIQCNCLYTF